MGRGRMSGPATALCAAGLTVALVTGGTVTGCTAPSASESGGGTGRTGPTSSQATTSPRVTTDAELCTRAVVYWSGEALDSGTYGDYQSMGLSDAQYDILREVVAAARSVRRRQGAAAARELVARRAREDCAARYRDGRPGRGPWR